MLSKFISCLTIAMISLLVFFANPVFAADINHGAKIFTANCAACHIGGKNVVNGAKTLQKSDLEKYGMDSAEAIIAQVTNGKNAMPAFGNKLSATEIEDVAAYVLSQAEQG
ncbi:MAG: cytochrome c6, partial [Cyanobacteria bacterium J083]